MKSLVISATSFRTNNLDSFFNDIRKFKQLSMSEELNLITLAKNGDSKAKNAVINSNLRFVVSVAKHYQNLGLEVLDLINEGAIGLQNAINDFDTTKGNKFITFAVAYVRQQIMLAIDNDSRLVRLPHNAHKTNNYCSTSLDAPLGNDEDGNEKTYLDTFASDMRANEYDHKQTIEYKVKSLLSGLSAKEQQVIVLTFGLGCQQEFEDTIAKRLNLTSERVRQIKHEALNKMRQM